MNIIKKLKDFAQNLSVLIVEDDISLNKEFVNLAELFFKDVFFAYNAEDALDIYKNNPADIVITDIKMPKMDGITISRELKQINPNQDIVVISAQRDVLYLAKLIDIGIKHIIYKPFDHQELIYRLLKICEDRALLKETNKIQEVKEILKKNTNATFLPTLTPEMLYNIEYLLELRNDLKYYLEMFSLNGVLEEHVQAISSIFSEIYTTLSQIKSAANISIVIFEFANFLENIHFASLNSRQKENFLILESIYEDISQFIYFAFITPEVKKTFYLEDSLRSSLVELKYGVFDNFLIEEEL